MPFYTSMQHPGLVTLLGPVIIGYRGFPLNIPLLFPSPYSILSHKYQTFDIHSQIEIGDSQ